MPEIRHLQSPPITEAIIDIRVKARPDFNVAEFSNLKSSISNDFPNVEEMRGGRVHFQINPQGPRSPEIQDLGLQGFFFKNKTQDIIAQFRIDGFSLNKLKPYSSWDALRPLAVELWEKYRSIAKPEAVTRIALRYINHIIINEISVDFDEYFRAAPQVPKELPQALTDFFYRTTIFDSENKNFVHVAQVFELQPPSIGTTIILDIDAYKDVAITANDPTLFDNFISLRSLKNRVFFNYLTEKTIGLFT